MELHVVVGVAVGGYCCVGVNWAWWLFFYGINIDIADGKKKRLGKKRLFHHASVVAFNVLS